MNSIIAHLVDGRIISVPLVWSWRLSDATAAQRSHFEILGGGRERTGLTSTKTSVPRECSTGLPPAAPSSRPDVRPAGSGAGERPLPLV